MPKISTDLEVAAAGSLGAAASWALSSPSSPIKKELPKKTIKNLEYSPFLGIKEKHKTLHIHHWIFFSFVFASLAVIREPSKGKRFINGFILGLIVQGLTYNDRFKIRNKIRSNN